MVRCTATPRDSSTLDVDGGGRFNGGCCSFSGSTGAGSTVLFDQSDNSLKFVENDKVVSLVLVMTYRFITMEAIVL